MSASVEIGPYLSLRKIVFTHPRRLQHKSSDHHGIAIKLQFILHLALIGAHFHMIPRLAKQPALRALPRHEIHCIGE